MRSITVRLVWAAVPVAMLVAADTPRARPATATERQDVPAVGTPSPGGTGAPQETPTFRVGTRLATIDAVVVDDKGRHVTDLTPADFEIVERGKQQPVRQALYVRAIGPDGRPMLQPTTGASPAQTTPVEPAKPRPLAGGGLASAERASRVLAIVVDDLGMSFRSTVDVRRMLTRYVDSTIGPGDLVAIIRTAGGVGTLQQFTTDRRLLHAAIDRVRWTFQSRAGVAAFDAITPTASTELVEQHGPSFDLLRPQVATAGTLGALEYVLRGIEALPGRKSVVFVSEGFDLAMSQKDGGRTWAGFTRVMARANRAGVVIYTLDPRGLETGALVAEDAPQARVNSFGSAAAGDATATARAAGYGRVRALVHSQESLIHLAQQTGGFAIVDNNGLVEGLARIVADTRGYYLIGFDTGIAPSERWDPNDVRIRVKRSGLRLRARRGLFGPSDTQLPRESGPSDPLVSAALSPFSAGAIDVRLTTLFAHDKKAGSYVRTLFFIDPAGLSFVDGAGGKKESDLSLLLLAVGDNGQTIGQTRRQLQLRLDDDEYRVLRQRGLLYSARLGIKEPGGYQVRAAVQDDRSKAIGTSAQFVEVPKVGKDHVALSGVVMMDVASATANPGEGAAPTGMRTDAIADGVLGEPAIKIFKPGSEVAYTFEIYDGRGKRTEGFATQATLLRDGKPFYSTPPAPVGAAPLDAKPVGAVPVGGTLSLGRGLPRGMYTLRVSVAPQSGKGRGRQAAQWVDFEVR